jgi:pyruvate kinase
MYPIECTKIIATIGPATASLERIRELIRAGADACRVNFSHGSGATLGPLMETIREAARLEERAIPILADIQGPKLRIGSMPAAGALLVEGNTFTLTPRDVEGSDVETHTAHERLCEDVEPGTRILLADGAIELTVESVKGRDVVCRVVTGSIFRGGR